MEAIILTPKSVATLRGARLFFSIYGNEQVFVSGDLAVELNGNCISFESRGDRIYLVPNPDGFRVSPIVGRHYVFGQRLVHALVTKFHLSLYCRYYVEPVEVGSGWVVSSSKPTCGRKRTKQTPKTNG